MEAFEGKSHFHIAEVLEALARLRLAQHRLAEALPLLTPSRACAFVAAGAETVVMSLWKVDDETTGG